MDLRPTAANLIETWRGRDVVDEVLTRLSQPKNRDFISSAWKSFYEARVAGVSGTIHAFNDAEPQAKIA